MGEAFFSENYQGLATAFERRVANRCRTHPRGEVGREGWEHRTGSKIFETFLGQMESGR